MRLRDVFRRDWDLANSRTMRPDDAHGWEPFGLAVEPRGTVLYFKRRVGFWQRLGRWLSGSAPEHDHTHETAPAAA